MKTEKCYLVLAVVIGILCAPVLGDVQLLSSGERQSINRPYGVLAGLDTVDFVDMTVLCPDPNKDAEFWKGLYDKVVNRFPPDLRMRPTLRSSLDRIYKIRIEILAVEGSSNRVAHVQSSLTSHVPVKDGSALADVWMTEPAMKVVQMQNLHEAVSAMVLEQAEEFISDYQKANPSPTSASDVNVVSMTGATKRPQRIEESRPAEYKFVASKNSDVFHRPDCASAMRIKKENLVGYSSRQAAINAGKRPCKRCNP